ncbi:MAG TPA: hypothetical protein VD788_09895, partial [Candidatus Polarisedimenticolaceae bacterium]|nr:hypothetical protein [Candidatus Polarisedimenticolaceae bacterium]
MSIRSMLVWLAIVTGMPSWAADPEATCPTRNEVSTTLRLVDVRRGSRTARFGADPPFALYDKAAANVGRPVASRDGKTMRAVLVIDRPVETIWKALNDEPHHALDGKYLPLRHSEVIGGTPRGIERTLFQYFKKAGIGRWWVSRVEMNGELYRDSAGRIWELSWRGVSDQVDAAQPPISMIADELPPLEETYGAWFLVPLDPRCTLIEYFNHTEPGGFVSIAQNLLAKSSLRETLQAIVRLADEHLPEADPAAVFL